MEAKNFIINTGPGGTFRSSGSYQTLPEHIDKIFERFDNDKVDEISIYFHGGLVNEKSGTETAFKMAKHFLDAGQIPICFVWETGLMETISTNIGKITDTKLFNKLIKVLVKKLSEKLGFDLLEGRGTGNLLTDEEIELELSKPVPFESYSNEQLATSGRGVQAIDRLPDNENILLQSLELEFRYLIEPDFEFVRLISETRLTIDNGQQEQSRGIISSMAFIKHVAVIAFKVIKRFIKKRDHGFYPTIIEEVLRKLHIAELGSWVWSNMKVKSSDMWNDNQDLSGLNRFAGRYFLEKLIDYGKEHNDVKVNLIGHSAGAIAICNLLNATASIDKEFVYSKIVFMAPACRVDLFHKEVVLNKAMFQEFRMYTMYDEFEIKDNLVPYFYTRSLLYLVSGILEDEGKEYDSYILGLERHIDGQSPYNSSQELLETHDFLYKTKTLALSVTDSTAPKGLKTKSITHGGFDDDDDTVESIMYFLNE